MEIAEPIKGEIMLRISDSAHRGSDYPSSRLNKGLILVFDEQELVEEGVGFGVPILKLGHHTIFAGDLDLSSHQEMENQIITALFHMNLEERMTAPKSGSIEIKQLYSIKNSLAWLMRMYPMLRSQLSTLSNGLRYLFNWQTTYVKVESYGIVEAIYNIDPDAGSVQMSFSIVEFLNDDITEIVVMNEQGAHYFNHYHDSSGLDLWDKEIGCWDEVYADKASFICDQYQLAFQLGQVDGARLFRGRELIGKRLAWSGFGYSFPSSIKKFHSALRIEQLP